MLTYSSLVLISITIGILVGAVGVGGFFMPTALTLVAGVTIHQGTATSLFTFIFTGIVGAFYFHKKGSINWMLVWPLCIGAMFTGFVGAWIGSKLSTTMLSAVLAIMIMSVGIYTFEPPRKLWRLLYLREWSHEESKQVFPRGARARSTDGAGTPRCV
ncbi:sulfite exporter TauE/SafE family protein, partial [Herminiimonas contaminans]|nr:sulfite exporter TauE/SafE family protein [Herminiimonas contaminans]